MIQLLKPPAHEQPSRSLSDRLDELHTSIRSKNMNIAIIEQCVPWVEDLLAQIEDPDRAGCASIDNRKEVCYCGDNG